MKRIKYLLFLLPALLVGCFDENDLDENIFDSAPLVSIDEPGGTVSFGEAFNVVFTFTDGNQESASLSPLSTASYTIEDAIGNMIDSGSPSVSGISTTTTIPFASGLPLGDYTIDVTVTDTQGNTAEATSTFTVSEVTTVEVNGFTMNYAEMYMLGSMNGFGSNNPDYQMTAVDDNIWEVMGVELAGTDIFKFAIDQSFTISFGDIACDGMAEEIDGLGTDTDCGFSGRFTVRFNDETTEYELIPGFESNVDQLFILGSQNNFEGTDLAMALTADNTWTYEELEIDVDDAFRISETPTLANMHYGQDGSGSTYDTMTEVASGTAEEFGSNFVLPAGAPHGRYDIQYNDIDQSYTFTLVEQLSFASNETSVFVLGEMNGWGSNSPDYEMTLVDDFTWQVENVVISSTNPFLFVTDTGFSKKWGDAECDGLTNEGGADIACGFDGTFTFTFNDQTLEYTVE
ncbi:MAG: hypothetical protein AAF149_11945 [Bacteroidota bacterium]